MRFLVAVAALVAALAMPVAAPGRASAATCPWVGSSASIEDKVAQVVGQMTLDEKISMLGITNQFGYENAFAAIPRLCIPQFVLQDGPAGVGAGLTGVTQLPAPITAAAAWDPSVAGDYGGVQGSEAWGKGIEDVQGPDVNIARVPENGRTFEAYGEDPYLVSRTALADLNAIQRAGPMAMVKHFIANNQETNRTTINETIDDRTLHEIYYPAFQAAVEDADVASAMCAYNQVNGTFACQDKQLLTDLLKNDWQFQGFGFVRSDLGAVHDTIAAYNAGLDQAKPPDLATLKAAVEAGEVPMSRVDDAVSRILREMFRFGLFEHQPTGTPSTVVTTPAHADAARTIAEQGTVLLKNAGNILPLSGSAKSIAVIGPDGGDAAYTAGAGSSHVLAPYVVTPYQGIRARAGGDVDVTYTQGIAPNGGLPVVPASALTGLVGRYYNNQSWSGDPVLTRDDPNVDFTWGEDGTAVSPGPGVNAEHWSAKWTGTLTAPATGTYTFSLTSDDGSTLSINGQQVVDNGGNHAAQTRQGTIDLVAGRQYPIEVDYFNNTAGDQVHLGWLPPGTDQYAAAKQAASSADVAIVFANDVESEGADRPDLALPGGQDALISAVASANPNTIVVLNTGSAVTMPWLSGVKGVVEGWYAGQEDGNAIAAVLFGDVNPSGKLPITFPNSEADTPARTPAQWPGVNGVADYSEGLQVGYRWYDAQGIEPLFPFGYGLSYTTFSLKHVTVGQHRLMPNGRETISVDVTNTGARAGAEVVQLYVGMPASLGEPPKQLKGYQKVALQPGQTRNVRFTLAPRDLAYWDTTAHGGITAAGNYTVMVGTSSRDIAAQGTFQVAKTTAPRYVTTTAPPIAGAGSTIDVTTAFTNLGETAVRKAQLGLSTPDGWAATPTSPTSFSAVASGQTVQATWQVSVPADAAPDTYPLTGTSSYQTTGGTEQVSYPTSVTVPHPSLASAFNNVGITDDADHTPGNFDGSGNSYSAQALADVGITPGATLTERGVGLTWPDAPAGTRDDVAAGGQVIAVSGSGSTLAFLGAATNGTQTGTGTVYYTDGTSASFPLAFADWISAKPADGDDLVATTAYINRTKSGPARTPSVFAAYAPLDAGKQVAAIALPNNANLHLFSVAIGG